METYQIIIILVKKLGFDLYTPTQESFIHFAFPPEVIQDMEVMNSEAFIAQIVMFLTNAALPPSMVTILLSQELLFVQDMQTIFPAQEENKPPQILSVVEQQKKIQAFLETVPFENIESKTYPLDGAIRVVATNKTLYDDIITAFEKLGSTVRVVIPGFILGTANEGEGLDDEVITTVIKNNEALLQQSFTIHTQEIVLPTSEEKKKAFLSMPRQQTKLYAYVGVFILLLGVLGSMYKAMLDQNTMDNKHIAPTTPSSAVIVQNTTTPTIAVPVASFIATNSAVIDKSKITVEIQTNPSTQTQGQLIKNKLIEKGYINVLVTTNAPTATKTLILFSTTLQQAIQQDITNIISNIFTNFSIQQATQSQFDITIIPSANL